MAISTSQSSFYVRFSVNDQTMNKVNKNNISTRNNNTGRPITFLTLETRGSFNA